MHIHRWIIISIGLLLLAGVVAAADNSTISSSSNWIVANGVDHSTIAAIVQNASATMSGVTVSFSLDNSTFGTISPVSAVTDGSGLATTTFTAKKKSGMANITATFTYHDGASVNSTQKTYAQNIDHDTPYTVIFTYKNEVTVDTWTPFAISLSDAWGNPIDNRNPNNIQVIALHIGSVAGNAAFTGGVTDVTLTPDLQGNVSVLVKTDTVAGENIIWMKALGAIKDQYKSIVGVTDAIPFSITQAIQPDNPASEPADMAGNHKFTFIYTLHDKYGNVASNQTIWVHTSVGGEDQNLTSNVFGQVWMNYGPRGTAGIITITATSVTNTSVSCTKNVEFYSTAPVSAVFSANPDTIPSLDVNGTSRAVLQAKVMDIKGNPVSGQTVSFSLGTAIYDDPYVIRTSEPALSNTSAITDANGFAEVNFIPGGFSTDQSNVHYNPTATGKVYVTAVWNGVPESAVVTWKNYPYLKVGTSVSSSSINVNDTFDVTISMKGDGWALQGQPADVVIVTDLAGGVGGGALLTATKSADTTFIQNANNITYIGLVSFGNSPVPYNNDAKSLYTAQGGGAPPSLKLFNPYGNFWDWCLEDPVLWNTGRSPSDIIINGSAAYKFTANTGYNYFNSYSDATIDCNITSHQVEMSNTIVPPNTVAHPLQTAISQYNGVGGTNYASGVNAALQVFSADQNPSHSQSIIIMGDGIPMVAPISPGSLKSYWPSDWYPRSNLAWEDESDTAINAAIDAANQARAQGITVYAVGLPLNGQIDENTLKAMAGPPGQPGSPNYYFKTDVNGLTTKFVQIQGLIQNDAGVNTSMAVSFKNVNLTGVTVPGAQLFNYVYDPAASTKITWQDGNTNVTDQTSQWNTDQTLHFTIGTIKLGQTWTATFRLKAKQAGNIDVFGNSSIITFNNGQSFLGLPKTFETVIANLTNTGMTMQAIQISNLQVTQTGVIKDFMPIQWNTTYPGTQTATERIYYSNDNQQSWVQFNTISILPGEWTNSANLDVRNLPPGEYYIRVLAQSTDAVGDEKITSAPIQVGTAGRAYIKLD
jgi:hypothetical protein